MTAPLESDLIEEIVSALDAWPAGLNPVEIHKRTTLAKSPGQIAALLKTLREQKVVVQKPGAVKIYQLPEHVGKEPPAAGNKKSSPPPAAKKRTTRELLFDYLVENTDGPFVEDIADGIGAKVETVHCDLSELRRRGEVVSFSANDGTGRKRHYLTRNAPDPVTPSREKTMRTYTPNKSGTHRQIREALSSPKSVKELADELNLKVATVRYHIAAMKKTNEVMQVGQEGVHPVYLRADVKHQKSAPTPPAQHEEKKTDNDDAVLAQLERYAKQSQDALDEYVFSQCSGPVLDQLAAARDAARNALRAYREATQSC